jgi:hypothetical protein
MLTNATGKTLRGKKTAKNEKSASAVLGKRKLTSADAASVSDLHAKNKREWEDKKQVEKLINESMERPTVIALFC